MTQDGTFPPAGFTRIPSEVEGITVFAPAIPVSDRPELIDFKCPKCGATIAYRVEKGGLACDHCGYIEITQAEQVGKSAEEFEFTVETIRRSQLGWNHNRRELTCQRCGGSISIPADTLTYSCPFCASNKVLYREPLEDILRPRFLIPFMIEPITCQEITKNWLGSSWMTPAQLKSAAPEHFQPIYIPYWTFTAVANATWKAMVGYEKTEAYYDEKGERHERTTIEWRAESGKLQKVFDHLLVPGTQRLNMTVLGQIDTFNIQDLVRYEPGLLAGMNAQTYDLPLEKAWEVGRHLLRERTRQSCRDRIASSHVRSFKMTLDFSNEEWRYILTPIYTSVYRYGEEIYQILINGQSGKIAGQRPADWQKIWLVIAGIFSPGVLLSLLGLITPQSGASDISSGLGLFLLACAVVIAFFILKQAWEMDHD